MSHKATKYNQLQKAAEAQLSNMSDTKQIPESVEELLHELEMHQIELEMQNNQLQQSQLELEKSRDQFVDFYDFAPVGYLTLNCQGIIDDLNLTCAALLGAERGNLPFHQFASYVAAEDTDHWYRHFQHILKHDGKQTCELRLKRCDKSCFYAQLDCIRLIKPGKTIEVRIVLADISDRKQAEEQLHIAAVTFETNDAILIADANLNIIRVNQAFIETTGYEEKEVLGQNPSILSSGQDKAFHPEMWQQLQDTGSWTGETWSRHKSGQIYPKWLAITAIKNKKGEIIKYVAMLSEIAARKHAEEDILNLAFYDALTKLPNRRLFLDRLSAALLVSRRHNNYGALLFIDLDRFKQLNDTRGHDYGDLLLIEVASRIKACARKVDTVSRFGGDEFVVLIEGISDDKGEASYKVGLVAEKIRELLAQPYHLNGYECISSPSIGVCIFCGNEVSVEDLIRHADMAMYQAKESGRNAVRFFDPVMQNNAAVHTAFVSDLRNAIALKQFHLHYQLQVDNDNRPVGAEALLRWKHPQRGIVMPDQFIQVAEESSLILDIDNWVLETACQQLGLWSKDDKRCNLVLTINISAKQFATPDFVDRVAKALQTHQINPACLKLELTESMVLDDVHNTVARMHEMKKLGVHLSMDDFGARYLSLSSLRQLPLDQLKLGRSFSQTISRDDDGTLLVESILDLANNYHLNVIAEGVETDAQLTLLKNRDCIGYQGFLFSKAVTIEEFEKLLN